MRPMGATGWMAAAWILPAMAQAQTPPPTPPAETPSEIVVKGRRLQLPPAEAPRSATCEMMVARDSYFRELMGVMMGENAGVDRFDDAAPIETATTGTGSPMILVPTRMPQNPDYAAPPLTPVGSPLPDLPRRRFGVRPLPDGDRSGGGPGAALLARANPDASANLGPSTLSSAETGIAACRAYYRTNGQQIDADRTLPTALALFEQRRFAESAEWFERAYGKLNFRSGGEEAALYLGKLYLMGLGAQSDPAKGVEWLKKAANAPFNPVLDTPVFDPARPDRNTAVGEAAVILANVYRRGFQGIARDSAEALKWYKRAFAVGHVAAGKTLGDLYLSGSGVPRDPKAAANWYERAAKLDLPAAQVALADLLSDGAPGVAPDKAAALRWYNAAAAHDDGAALFALARAYDLGEGVKADPQRALGFYKTAALHGDAAAKTALGTYFYEGKLVPRDPATARKWFEAAAAGDDADGMFDLAAMMVRGEGGARDLPGAWTWMTRAGRAGHTGAPAARAALEKQMTAADRERAAALLKAG